LNGIASGMQGEYVARKNVGAIADRSSISGLLCCVYRVSDVERCSITGLSTRKRKQRQSQQWIVVTADERKSPGGFSRSGPQTPGLLCGASWCFLREMWDGLLYNDECVIIVEIQKN
jgi:hypothetical protein